MTSDPGASVSRRAFLTTAGLAAGFVASGAARRLGLFGPLPFETLDPRAALERLYTSLSPGQRALFAFDWDHPSRQVTNASPVLTQPHLGTVLGAEQRDLLARVVGAMLSEEGHVRYAPTIARDAGGLEACALAIYGTPGGPMQMSVSGGHLHLRWSAGRGVAPALGGAVCYGHQTGDGIYRTPGNAFVFQSELANEVYRELPAALQGRARVRALGSQHVLQVQDEAGRFPGLAFARMSDAARTRAEALVRTILSSYAPEEYEAALSSIAHNGGFAALHLALADAHGYYPDRSTVALHGDASERNGHAPFFQVWQVEGPGTMIRFQGDPHVHAYIQIVRDVSELSVGEVIARSDTPQGDTALRRLVRRALVDCGDGDYAHYPWPAASRLRPGEITTGDIWCLDPFDHRVVTAVVRGAAMAPPLREELAAQGHVPDDDRTYRIATVHEEISSRGSPSSFGNPDRIEETGIPLRDALVHAVRTGGLSA